MVSSNLIDVVLAKFVAKFDKPFGYFDMYSKYNHLWIVLSSLCYSFVHIIYKDVLTCVLTFIIGIIWYMFYKKDKNLCGVTLSHMVLGVATIVLGIIN